MLVSRWSTWASRVRGYAVERPAPILFDNDVRRKHRLRHAGQRASHDFLWREGADIVGDSLDAITHRFPRVAELAPPNDDLTRVLKARKGTDEVLIVDDLRSELLPFEENSLDAIAANLSIHTINDLPGLLIQARRALKPDGLFIATLPGAESLRELRQVLAETESAVSGGVSPRVAPFIEVREAGNLLSRAGFALPVSDSITFTLTYSNLFSLMHELRGAGEANMLTDRKKSFTPRGFFVAAAERYAAQHNDGEGRIVVTAEIITLTAWKPAATQQQPARRGSGTTNLGEALKN